MSYSIEELEKEVEKDEAYWHRRNLKSSTYLGLQIFFGLPKSIIYNLKYFGKKGLRLPVLLSYKVKLKKLSGRVILDASPRTGMIKLGFTAPEFFDNHRLSFIWVNDGVIIFRGSAGMRNGVSIRNYGVLEFGDEFHISAPSTLICYKRISFGKDVLIGWDCEFQDGDAHKIYSVDNTEDRLNENKGITVGDHVWFGAHSRILKGVTIGSDTIVASNTLLSKTIEGQNQVVGGNPVRVIKSGVTWKT